MPCQRAGPALAPAHRHMARASEDWTRHGVAETSEAVNAVVRSYARRTHAAEGHALDHGMRHHIVDDRRAGSRAFEKRLLLCRVIAEVIGRERARMRVDVIKRLLRVMVGQHRQDRAEDFFLHHLHVFLRIEHQGRGELARACVSMRFTRRLQPYHAGTPGAGVVQQADQAAVVAVADDGGVVRVVMQRRQCAGDKGTSVLHESVARRFWQKHIIRRDADLTDVEGLDRQYTRSGGSYVSIRVNENG